MGLGKWLIDTGGKGLKKATKELTKEYAKKHVGKTVAKGAGYKEKKAALKEGYKLAKEALKKAGKDPAKLQNAVKSLGLRGSWLFTLGNFVNVAGYVWMAYEAIDLVWTWWASYHKQKIHSASVLAGENQLVWLPLEYRGKEYVAGLEGLLGTPRSSNSILMGELSLEDPGNRHFYVMDNITPKTSGDPREF